MSKTTTALLASCILVSATTANAATVVRQFDFSRNNVSLAGASSFSFNRSTTLDAGIAVLDFGARASAGTVDASARVRLGAGFTPVVDLGSASSYQVSLSQQSLSFGFETSLGATAFAGINFDSFLGINPPRLSLGEVGFSVGTDATGSSFGTTVSDDAKEPISGFGLPTFPGISLQAEITLDASQESTFRVNDLTGFVRATHESGTIVTDPFSLRSDRLGLLDLGLPGLWELDLVNVAMPNWFNTSVGLAASARVGAAVGFDCGDFSDDDDNGFLCAGDVGSVASSPQLTLRNPPGFEINWGAKTASLGSVTVTAPAPPPPPVPNPIPLPAAAWLLLGGLGALGALKAGQRAV